MFEHSQDFINRNFHGKCSDIWHQLILGKQKISGCLPPGDKWESKNLRVVKKLSNRNLKRGSLPYLLFFGDSYLVFTLLLAF